MSRHILLVHPTDMVCKLIERFLRAEAPDTELHTTHTGEAAIRILGEQEMDVLVSGGELPDMSGTELSRRLQVQGGERMPHLIITASPDDMRLQGWRRAGVTGVLAIPFSAKEFIDELDELCHPRVRRRHSRVCVPGMEIEVCTGDLSWRGEVTNFSLGGALVDLPYRHDMPAFFGEVEYRIHLPEDVFPADPGPAVCAGRFVRMEVLSVDPDGTPEYVRAAWRFEKVAHEAYRKLEAALDAGQQTNWDDLPDQAVI
jgi:CheY-like chemotaxis protein